MSQCVCRGVSCWGRDWERLPLLSYLFLFSPSFSSWGWASLLSTSLLSILTVNVSTISVEKEGVRLGWEADGILTVVW